MQYNLRNKIIIITGGNSGIGKAAVILACRSKERGLQAQKRLWAVSELLTSGV